VCLRVADGVPNRLLRPWYGTIRHSRLREIKDLHISSSSTTALFCLLNCLLGVGLHRYPGGPTQLFSGYSICTDTSETELKVFSELLPGNEDSSMRLSKQAHWLDNGVWLFRYQMDRAKRKDYVLSPTSDHQGLQSIRNNRPKKLLQVPW